MRVSIAEAIRLAKIAQKKSACWTDRRQYMSLSESFGRNTLLRVIITYNPDSGNAGYYASFAATNGHILPQINIEG